MSRIHTVLGAVVDGNLVSITQNLTFFCLSYRKLTDNNNYGGKQFSLFHASSQCILSPCWQRKFQG